MAKKLKVPAGAAIDEVTIENNQAALVKCFNALEDPRRDQGKLHPLASVLAIYFCALLAGRDGWEDAEDFGEFRKEWFSSWLDLPNGIPSKHTFYRVIQRISPKLLQHVFHEWLNSVRPPKKPDTLHIDGKKLCDSHEYSTGQGATHVINVWAQGESLIIAQEKVAPGTNELTAMRSVLYQLDLENVTVTADAIATQTDVAQTICDKNGHYLLAVKGNQSELFREIQLLFHEAESTAATFETLEKDHGRIERRKYSVLPAKDRLFRGEEWANLQATIKVESSRTIGSKTSKETRFYITSHEPNAPFLAQKIRGHWSIENSLHWILDVDMGEDECRVRKGYAPENLSWMRAFALGLLKKDPAKGSIRRKMIWAGDDLNYLKSTLFR